MDGPYQQHKAYEYEYFMNMTRMIDVRKTNRFALVGKQAAADVVDA